MTSVSQFQWRCCWPRKEMISSEQGILTCDWPAGRGFTRRQGRKEKRRSQPRTVQCAAQSPARARPSAGKQLPHGWDALSACDSQGGPMSALGGGGCGERTGSCRGGPAGSSICPCVNSGLTHQPLLPADPVRHLFSSRAALIPLTSKRWWPRAEMSPPHS